MKKGKKLNKKMNEALLNIEVLKDKWYAQYFELDFELMKCSDGSEFVSFKVFRDESKPYLPLLMGINTINDFRKDLGAKDAQIDFSDGVISFFP